MTATTLFGHLLGFCAQPLWLSVMAAVLAKAVWRSGLRRVGLLGLGTRLFAANLLVAVAGVAVFRHDGRMATDLAMVVATAAITGWMLQRRG